MPASGVDGTIAAPDMSRIEVVAPNLKKRLSGVTSTIVQLVPVQARALGIATIGPGLPDTLPKIRGMAVLGLWRRPRSGRKRIWHARRNTEMAAGLALRALGAPLHLVFTSAAQRHHRPFTKWLIRRMDAVIATSRRSGSFLEVPHEVVMHGVDLTAFRPASTPQDDFRAAGLEGERAVGCFGRIRHQKGTDLFVDAMIRLLPDHPGWTAVISGRVTPEHAGFAQDLKRRIADAGLEKRIVFLGEVDDIKPWYRRLSLYVAPSRNEGFGLTPLEAMASGVPVVASDAGAYAEMVSEGETGSVVPAGDGEALTRAIGAMLADPERTAALGRAALAEVTARFPLEAEAAGIRRVYDRVWAGG